MPNIVSIDEYGFVRQVYIGNQTEETMARTFAELDKIAADMKATGKKIYGIVDLTHLGDMTPRARDIAINAVRKFPYDKAVFYGANTFNKALASLVLLVAGKNRKIKMFVTEAEAIAWLNASN